MTSDDPSPDDAEADDWHLVADKPMNEILTEDQALSLLVAANAAATVGVCGFGRCGMTMAMAMLDAGGVHPLPGAADRSFELDLGCLAGMDLAGHAVKILDPAAWAGWPPARWRFVWMDRDATQQARSQAKMLRAQGMACSAYSERLLAESLRRDRAPALAALRERGPVLVLHYERVLAQPLIAATVLAQHVGVDDLALDARAAAAVVHRRGGACLSDLDFELTGKVPPVSGTDTPPP